MDEAGIFMKKTKYLNLLLVALTIVIFAGCGKSGSDDKNPIVGKWSYNTGGYTISYTFDNNGTGVRNFNGESSQKLTYEIKEDVLVIKLNNGIAKKYQMTISSDKSSMNLKPLSADEKTILKLEKK